jgi:hypothetical protein
MKRRELVKLVGMTAAAVTALGPSAFADADAFGDPLNIRDTYKVDHWKQYPRGVVFVVKSPDDYKRQAQQMSGLSDPHNAYPNGTVGWKAMWNGKLYGDFVIIAPDAWCDEAIEDVKEILILQARDCHDALSRKHR